MAIVQVNFNKKINSSLQVGDVAYVSEIKSAAGGIVDDPELVGVIIEINNEGIKVNDQNGKISDPQSVNYTPQFISFAKDIRVNESSLKGYYADVTFKNTSTTYAELFAISSEIVFSSK